MRSLRPIFIGLLGLLALGGSSSMVWAHGFAGQRFFPTTLATEDPFVSDEFSLLISHFKKPGDEEEPAVRETAVEVEYSKRLTPHLGLSLGGEFRHLDPAEGGEANGFGNVEVGIRYQFFTNARHEALLSLGFEAEIGGTGDRAVEAEPFSVLSPTLLFGKGWGDFPEALRYLRPVAITGLLAAHLPTEKSTTTTHSVDGELETAIERNPITLSWGFSLQYNLDYLQSFVQDIGLGAPFNRFIPVVEFALETCLNRGCRGETTGTVNAGILWFGKTLQLGAEAIIPLNDRTGKDVGVRVLVHVFLDDLLPHSLGRPLFP